MTKRHRIVLFWIALSAVLFGCSLLVEPFTVNMPELYTCRGPDEETGEPTGRTSVFSTADTRIYACGRLQTTRPVWLQIVWYHEAQIVLVESGLHESGYYYSWIQPRESNHFPVGHYKLEVLLAKTVLRSAEFEVRD